MSNPASWRTSTVTALLVLALAAGGCSGDDSGDDASAPSSSPSSAQGPPPEVKIRVLAGTLAGELPKKRRHAVARDVARVVDRWFVAAYLGGEYPRARFKDSWPGFTVGANALARHDRLLTSNAQLGDRIDGVRAVSKLVKVDVFSPNRRPAGATARFRLVFRTTGDAERRVVVTGRLLLTQARKRWKVFGFDVKKSVVPVGADKKKGEKS